MTWNRPLGSPSIRTVTSPSAGAYAPALPAAGLPGAAGGRWISLGSFGRFINTGFSTGMFTSFFSSRVLESPVSSSSPFSAANSADRLAGRGGRRYSAKGPTRCNKVRLTVLENFPAPHTRKRETAQDSIIRRRIIFAGPDSGTACAARGAQGSCEGQQKRRSRCLCDGCHTCGTPAVTSSRLMHHHCRKTGGVRSGYELEPSFCFPYPAFPVAQSSQATQFNFTGGNV